MFQFSGLAFLSECYVFNIAGCPIRRFRDVLLVCSSPGLIAAYHVLHRLSEPRHPPYALMCFKKFEIVFVTRPAKISRPPKTNLMMQKNYHVIDTLVLQTILSDVIWLSTNNYYFFVLLPICQRTIAD
jgi:hypothetical protein